MESDVVTLQDLFSFDFQSGLDDTGRHRGTLRPMGLRPAFIGKLEDNGTHVRPDLFGFEAVR